MIRDLLRFLWRRDCESTQCLIIELSNDLTLDGLRDMADYLMAKHDHYRQAKEQLIKRAKSKPWSDFTKDLDLL